jgi:(p)ppGpp synthase/HD superfamily hydrolase
MRIIEVDQENVVNKALAFAKDAHESIGQKRKYTGEDYIVHPIEVSQIVKSVGGSEVMQAAALLHDTVEDTNVTNAEIVEHFGPAIAKLVNELTDISKLEDGNRALRKEMDREHSASASADAQTVKLADLISNSKSIVKHDPNFAKVYIREKEALLQVLDKGNSRLHAIATKQVADAKETLKISG